MDVLLTWSGRPSHDVAAFFRSWLPTVLPGIQPWISDEDIAKGKKWFLELMRQLERANISITFVTPGNIFSPWVYYEVGAIAAKMEEGIVCPYLVGVDGKLVKDTPLGEFQWTEATKDDTWKLIRSMNQYLGERQYIESMLQGNFNTQWPKLKRQIDKVLESVTSIEVPVSHVEPPIEQSLSAEARKILVEASLDDKGRIDYINDSTSTEVQTNNKNLLPDQSPKQKALWRSAVQQLIAANLIVQMPSKGVGYNIFELSTEGHEAAERIKGRE